MKVPLLPFHFSHPPSIVCVFCEVCISVWHCLYTLKASYKKRETCERLYSLAISILHGKQERRRRGKEKKERMGHGMVGGCQTWDHKSIQLRHELQGSLSMSKPMKMTIHQKRVLSQCWKALACTHTTYNYDGKNAHTCFLQVERKLIARITWMASTSESHVLIEILWLFST